MRAYFLLPIAALLGSVGFVAVEACNSGTGDCPAKESISPGGSCSDDHLQCAYDLKAPNAACDGTSTAVETSCTCTHGTWACPETLECEAGAGDGGDEATPDEAGADDASPEPDGSGDAPVDAPDAG